MFASYFQKLGCKNALYLDGFVSRTYWPEGNWIQTDGNFGVIIGVLDKPIEQTWQKLAKEQFGQLSYATKNYY
jgi:hypothetical protein